jgi:penicillin-binding protein 2
MARRGLPSLLLLLLALVVVACQTVQPAPPPTATPAPPSADQVAASFFQTWQQGQYDRMYDLLSTQAQASTPRELFVRRYTNIHAGIGEVRLSVRQVGSTMTQSGTGSARVPFQVTRSLAVFGDLVETNELPLVQENGQWTIDWQPGLIFRDLTATSSVRVNSDVAPRGRIVDRAGRPLAGDEPNAPRVYPLADAAAQVVGYLGHPTAEELNRPELAGSEDSDWIGRAGIEAAFEKRLAGEKGGSIVIVDQAGGLVRTIAQKAAQPGEDVQLTLDADLQQQAASALGDQIGSAIVMDPRDGSLLALVSRPSFDPNRFVAGLSDAEWQRLNGESQPLVLRPTESAYATGSTFKVITMAAGLERGVVTPDDSFDCGLDWNGLPGVTLHNWQAQGRLNLVEALTESCNPAFYEIGLKLHTHDPASLPGFARAFGLGQPTGVAGVPESVGKVPEPRNAGEAVNLAIGQGALLASPLQLANAYAALANGGTLRTPLLVQGAPQATRGALPISASTRATIIEGMSRVTSTPRGTAAYAFQGERTPIAAKTGSAENENPEAHAWFVGFATPDQPRVLVLAMVEGGEHGGTVAAPVARKIIDYAIGRVR